MAASMTSTAQVRVEITQTDALLPTGDASTGTLNNAEVNEQSGALEPEQVLWFVSRQTADTKPETTTTKVERDLITANRPSWLPLSSHDCLMLELTYRQNSNVEKVSPPPSFENQSLHEPTAQDRTVPVKGDLWQVDVERRLAFPVYWTGSPCRIIRGTWFLDLGNNSQLQPLSEDLAAQIEQAFKQTPWKGREPDDPFKLSLLDDAHFVLFFADETILFYENSFSSRLLMLVNQKKTAGIPLKRAGRIIESQQEKQQRLEEPSKHEVSHLVLVVHGIGQRMDGADINSDVEQLQSKIGSFARTHAKEAYSKGSMVFLPVQWRRNLDLYCDGEPSTEFVTINEITLKDLASVRNVLNTTAVDVLLFMTPQHRNKILAKVSTEINRIYSKFIERNPDFLLRQGKVSVIGHSLGSIIMFDILCHVDPLMFSSIAVPELDDDDEMIRLKRQMRELEHRIQYHKRYQELRSRDPKKAETTVESTLDIIEPLKFEVDQFFALGSPIGIFMAIRGCRFAESRSAVEPNGSLVYPAVRKMFHMFHPSDPIAYRLEPFMDRSMVSTPPAYMPYAHGGKRTHIALQESVTRVSKSTGEFARNVQSSLTGIGNFFSRMKSGTTLGSLALPEPALLTPAPKAEDSRAPLSASNLLETLGDGRVDYMMQHGLITAELVNLPEGVRSHMNYWDTEDIALFLLLKLLDLPPSIVDFK